MQKALKCENFRKLEKDTLQIQKNSLILSSKIIRIFA